MYSWSRDVGVEGWERNTLRTLFTYKCYKYKYIYIFQQSWRIQFKETQKINKYMNRGHTLLFSPDEGVSQAHFCQAGKLIPNVLQFLTGQRSNPWALVICWALLKLANSFKQVFGSTPVKFPKDCHRSVSN